MRNAAHYGSAPHYWWRCAPGQGRGRDGCMSIWGRACGPPAGARSAPEMTACRARHAASHQPARGPCKAIVGALLYRIRPASVHEGIFFFAKRKNTAKPFFRFSKKIEKTDFFLKFYFAQQNKILRKNILFAKRKEKNKHFLKSFLCVAKKDFKKYMKMPIFIYPRQIVERDFWGIFRRKITKIGKLASFFREAKKIHQKQ